MNKGILYGIATYLMWGFFPIYWKMLHVLPALQVIGHRIVWSFALLLIFILVTGSWKDFRSVAFTPKTIGIYAIAGVLLSCNWLIYVWGVNAGFIVETSLGYFINPLLSVLFGVIFLRERLRPLQWLPIVIAAIGVIYLTFAYGSLPWIALSLAFTFGLYGLVKKLSPLGSAYGLTLETGIVFPIALIYLAFVQMNGTGGFLHNGLTIDLLLVGAGLVTTVPLLLFASAAKQIPLNMIGILQYFAPTIQFLIGVFLYKEPFDHVHLIGFSIVWVALIIFWVENIIANRKPMQPIPELGE
ncbi:MAG: EamA family transporter RarD [Anaerolineales bacterium]|nr:EamA family transporter RarD [Anaerolineales bacterium]MCB9146799.1 EamA family transporter RarD [Anaerolineales bacterium]